MKTPRIIQIATSGLGDNSITDETSLIRYMKLSTFLLLVSQNRLFLPTARKLQESDFREANIQLYYCSAYWRKMWPLVKPHKHWLLSDVLRSSAPEAWDELSEQQKKDLIRAWTGALAERRSVWCWNRSVDESSALWKIYAERGVAIYSKVGRLRTALENAGVKSGIVSPVTYIGKKEEVPEIIVAIQSLLKAGFRRAVHVELFIITRLQRDSVIRVSGPSRTL